MSEKIVLGPKQRRIRHLRSIAGRNFIYKSMPPNNNSSVIKDSSLLKQQGLLDAYFTLHIEDSVAFYSSEMIPNSVNPSFRTISFEWFDAASSCLTVRVWTRPSIPESAGQHTEPIVGYHQDFIISGFELFIEWQLNLNALSWIGKSLMDIGHFPENTLVFELEDGFYSAPDIKTALAQSKRSSLLDLDQSKLETASIHTVNSIQSKQKRSYVYNSIIKMNTLIECIFDTQKSSDEVKQEIQEVLEQEEESFMLKRALNQHKSYLDERESHILQQKRKIQAKQETIKQQQQDLENRKIDFLETTQRCQNGIEYLQENELVLEKNVKMRQSIFNTLNKRKKELIADLFSIYPIEQSYDDLQQFRIRGIYLPNSVYDGQNDEMIATALGYTAHLVSMLAYYLEIPLRYPINPMSSRSSIRDPVSLINGSREFPLYARGVDRYRFEFGVFLLNKNIEQLMNAYGLIVIDLRHTLPNIHYFIQAILTTSVTSTPTSISVLSISSYANGGSKTSSDEISIRQDHNHLTLQPTILPQPPSPSISTHSSNTLTHSPKISPSYNFINTPQAMTALFDAITTSSTHHSPSTS